MMVIRLLLSLGDLSGLIIWYVTLICLSFFFVGVFGFGRRRGNKRFEERIDSADIRIVYHRCGRHR